MTTWQRCMRWVGAIVLVVAIGGTSQSASVSRLHEPSINELAAEIDGLRQLHVTEIVAIRALIDERDRLYKERDDARRLAVEAALVAVKEQTKASFEASEKSVKKAEEAQNSYNASHNDLVRKMDEQQKATIPRAEADARFRGVEEKIAELKESSVAGSSKNAGYDASWGYVTQAFMLIIAIMGAFGFTAYLRRRGEKL